ncbi:hypothetical protein [Micromonospora carbonacea]|uniref:Uncharacterized protein n=1 Tax=Micromonospora carbonacea TaxID=47853 RepID=A0A1C5ADH9_9ACTN|nr:hypothetical protein [Micromonospora carbonacea]SCF43121.1 hypothetical protein GA0070563_112190 [Micromonospora carbonacea]
MIGPVPVADPGWVGFAVGGLLIVLAAALLWLRFSRRRMRAEHVAEVGPTYAVGVVRVPSAGPAWGAGRRVVEQPTQVIARTGDVPAATAVLPAVRGGRRG